MAQAAAVTSLEQGALENDQGVPLFLFCCFRTTGSNLLTDDISEMAARCWPYREEVQSFHYQILNRKTKFIVNGCKNHGRFQHAVGELCRWMQRTVNTASAELNTQLYPVLFCHGGDSRDFLFFFRSCAKYGIDLDTVSSLPIHFADPVPLLELLKARRHPLMSDCKCLTLGSLLNDWFPGMFDSADLSSLPARADFTTQLYTRTTLHPVLSKVPIYNVAEWGQYYDAALKYKEDKRELEAHMPNHIKEVQAKFAVRAILRAGYSWSTLLDLYRSCASPLQFRQELRDIDVKSSLARDITWMIADMKLEQMGTRPYVLKIKKNMQPQEYVGRWSRRGYYFVLRVANKFPQCFLTLADLEFSLEDHPIEVPRGFSLTQRLSGPESVTSPRSPGGAFEFIIGDPFHQDDGEVMDGWLEEERESEGEGSGDEGAGDFLESYYQFQKEREAHHEQHKITSFVMNVELNRSLLLNCMEEEGELDSSPRLTEDEQRRRAALWDSVRENLPKTMHNRTANQPPRDLDKSGKTVTNQRGSTDRASSKPPNKHRGPRKGGGGGRRRGREELRRWNKRQRGEGEDKENCDTLPATKVQGLPKQSAVNLPGTSVGSSPEAACGDPSGDHGFIPATKVQGLPKQSAGSPLGVAVGCSPEEWIVGGEAGAVTTCGNPPGDHNSFSATKVEGLPEQPAVSPTGATVGCSPEEQILSGAVGHVAAFAGLSGDGGNCEKDQLGEVKQRACAHRCTNNRLSDSRGEEGHGSCHSNNRNKTSGSPGHTYGPISRSHGGGGDSPGEHFTGRVAECCGRLSNEGESGEKTKPSGVLRALHRHGSHKSKGRGRTSRNVTATCGGHEEGKCKRREVGEGWFRCGTEDHADMSRIVVVRHPSGLGVDIIYPTHWEAAKK